VSGRKAAVDRSAAGGKRRLVGIAGDGGGRLADLRPLLARAPNYLTERRDQLRHPFARREVGGKAQ